MNLDELNKGEGCDCGTECSTDETCACGGHCESEACDCGCKDKPKDEEEPVA